MTNAEGTALTEGLFAHADGNYAAALQKWRPLAERGIPAAQALLGHLHLKGEGVRQDRRKARACFLRAAKQGDETALRKLRALAEAHRSHGEFVEAYAWFATAAAFGNRRAATQRDTLAKLLTAKQLDRAKLRAQSHLKTITAGK